MIPNGTTARFSLTQTRRDSGEVRANDASDARELSGGRGRGLLTDWELVGGEIPMGSQRLADPRDGGDGGSSEASSCGVANNKSLNREARE